MALFGGVTIPNRPDPDNIRRLDLLPLPQLRRMQRVGIAINPDRLAQLSSQFAAEQKELRKDICAYIPEDKLHHFSSALEDEEDMEGWGELIESDEEIRKEAERSLNLNVDSAEQIAKLLFEILEIGKNTRLKVTKSGTRLSTGKKQLETLKLKHPIIPKLLEYREISKLRSTYTDKLARIARLHPKGHNCPICSRRHYRAHPRIHTSLLTTRTVTGRMASKNPNLNNIPARSKRGRMVREAFEAQEGYVLVDRDYAQIELRGVADQSGDPNMIRIFKANGDIHTATAIRAFDLPDEKSVDKLLHRAPCKNVNFGVCLLEGQQVRTSSGLVPIESVTPDMLLWDGEGWVRSDGAVYKGYKRIIRWDGIAATPDHKVWLQTGERVSLSQAMATRSRIAVTDHQGTPVRYPSGYFQGDAHEERGSDGHFSVFGLWGAEGCTSNKPSHRCNSEMQVPHWLPISRSPGAGKLIDEALHRNCAEVLESKLRIIPGLRGQGDKEQVQVINGVHALHSPTSAAPDLQGSGCRENQQRWSLRTWKYQIGDQRLQPSQHSQERVDRLQGGESDWHGFVAQVEAGLRGLRFESGKGEDTSEEGLELAGYLAGASEGEVGAGEEEEWGHVYDIMNAGPRRRFTVEGKLVSNCYGLGPEGLMDLMTLTYATALQPVPEWLTVEWCERFIEQWFGLYPDCRSYFAEQHRRCMRYGIIWDPMGRVRRIPEVYSVHERVRMAGLRQGGNMPIQGFAAEIFKIGLARTEGLYERLREGGVDVEALVPVHDEQLTEVPEDWGEMVNDMAGEEMDRALVDEETGVEECRVPVRSDGKVSFKWEKE